MTLPGYKTSYDDRSYLPKDLPANLGYAAADRHFSQSRMLPDILTIQSDHDMRNPADFLVLHKLAKAIFRVPGISRVQGITRPEGTPIEHTSIPFLISVQNAALLQNMEFMKARMNDMLKQADSLARQITILKHLYAIQQQLTAVAHDTVGVGLEKQAILDELEDHLADFDDFFRPIRSYFYWEKHCHDIPLCSSFRSIFDLLDGVNALRDILHIVIKDAVKADELAPQLLPLTPRLIAIAEASRTILLTNHSTTSGLLGGLDGASQNATAMGQAFDAAKNDDSFYLPPDIFQNPNFQRAVNSFMSPDGKAARFIISHAGDPATPEGIARIDRIRTAAEEGAQDHSAGEREDFPRRRRVDLQRLRRRRQIRSVDRARWCALSYFRHHARPHTKFCGRPGYRGHSIAFVGRIVWAVGAGVAVHSGHQIALDGASDVRDRPLGGRI